jgi:hypothetical protein
MLIIAQKQAAVKGSFSAILRVIAWKYAAWRTNAGRQMALHLHLVRSI